MKVFSGYDKYVNFRQIKGEVGQQCMYALTYNILLDQT